MEPRIHKLIATLNETLKKKNLLVGADIKWLIQYIEKDSKNGD